MQGILLIDKTEGLTSFDVVHRIRKLTGEKKVGHTGTLDPLATGVLPVLIGRATKLSDKIMSEDKIYRAAIRLGTVTDTLDITGNVLATSSHNITSKQLEDALEGFIGDIEQVPPMFSAIKKDGVKLYKLAREGKTVELEPRHISVYSIKITKPLADGEFEIEVHCSKGTYIRSLCRDIGEKLGCGAVMTGLRRISSGKFSIEDSVPLSSLTADNICNFVKPPETAFMDNKSVNLSEKQAARFSNGLELNVDRLKCDPIINGESVLVYYNDICLGLGTVSDGKIKQDVLFASFSLSLEKRKPCAICLGTFDGIHLGHRSVLNKALSSEYIPVALVFSFPPSGAGALMSLDDKKVALKNMGFKKVAVLKYEEIKDMTFTAFEDYIVSRFNVALICCGYDYSYGKGRQGNAETLRAFCEKKGIEISVSSEVKTENKRASSTEIRRLIAEGEIDKANSLLLNPFSFTADVTSGDKRGRKLGFPTINQVYPENLVKPKFGVYKVEVEIDGKSYKGISNIGLRPTFKTESCTSETYIMDFSGDLYGKSVKITLLKFIREERKFSDIDELINQINEDIKTASV